MTELTDRRRQQILALLDTRNDNLPDQRGPRRAHSSGFAHKVRVTLACEDCLANGRVMPKCETCRGRGHVEVWRATDPYAVTKVQPYGIDPTRHDHAYARDVEIDRLASQTRDPYASEADELADANQNPYGWERARSAMYARFDYAALDRALDELRQRYPFAFPHSEFGLAVLSMLLPAELRAPVPPAAVYTEPKRT